MKRLLHAIAALALCLSAFPVMSQTPESQPPWSGANATLDRGILRLSEITGALAFLRDLCAAPDAGEWPKLMQQLLAAEGTTPERKGRIAGAYNKGYRDYALTYRTCTPSAKEAARRHIAESDKLANTILRRYGN